MNHTNRADWTATLTRAAADLAADPSPDDEPPTRHTPPTGRRRKIQVTLTGPQTEALIHLVEYANAGTPDDVSMTPAEYGAAMRAGEALRAARGDHNDDPTGPR